MLNRTLKIKEPKDFIITKVQGNFIRFKYNEEKYQLDNKKNITDKDIWKITLRKYNEQSNSYEFFGKTFSNKRLSHYIVDSCSKHKQAHPTYSLLDKVYLMKNMTELGLFKGIYEELCEYRETNLDQVNARLTGLKGVIEQYESYILSLKEEICKLEKEKTDLGERILAPTGHGSKIYNRDIKARVSDRIVGSGHQTGEFIEKYNAKIGDTHPNYGGVLTDLRNLPYGTAFYVTNGDWNGEISSTEKGNKSVFVRGHQFNNIELTEDNCCLYIEVELSETA